jgi:hypothetical protein
MISGSRATDYCGALILPARVMAGSCGCVSVSAETVSGLKAQSSSKLERAVALTRLAGRPT